MFGPHMWPSQLDLRPTEVEKMKHTLPRLVSTSRQVLVMVVSRMSVDLMLTVILGGGSMTVSGSSSSRAKRSFCWTCKCWNRAPYLAISFYHYKQPFQMVDRTMIKGTLKKKVGLGLALRQSQAQLCLCRTHFLVTLYCLTVSVYFNYLKVHVCKPMGTAVILCTSYNMDSGTDYQNSYLLFKLTTDLKVEFPGSVLLSLPVLHGLDEWFPDCQVLIVVHHGHAQVARYIQLYREQSP